MCIFDQAAELEEKQREVSLKMRKDAPKSTGFCLNCGDSVNRNQCFCDIDCSKDYECRLLIQHISGKR